VKWKFLPSAQDFEKLQAEFRELRFAHERSAFQLTEHESTLAMLRQQNAELKGTLEVRFGASSRALSSLVLLWRGRGGDYKS